jgi:hypothetical protein
MEKHRASSKTKPEDARFKALRLPIEITDLD